MEVIRATEEFQRAGAYYVRIQAMNRQHHIPLREEIDEIDGPGCRYIVVLDDGFPAATCRWSRPRWGPWRSGASSCSRSTGGAIWAFS